jgi:hypothetical protein
MADSQASDSRGFTVVLTSIAFVAIAGAFVTLRFVARAGLLRRCGADDFLIMWAFALSVTLTILIAIRQCLSHVSPTVLAEHIPRAKTWPWPAL